MGCLKLVGGWLDNWGLAIAVNGEDGKIFSNLFLNTLTEGAATAEAGYYGRYTSSGSNFRHIIEVNRKNLHETQVIELAEGTVVWLTHKVSQIYCHKYGF